MCSSSGTPKGWSLSSLLALGLGVVGWLWGASWGPLVQWRMCCHRGSSRPGPSHPFLLCVPMCSTRALPPSVFLGAPPERCTHPAAWGSLHPHSAPGARGGPRAEQAEPRVRGGCFCRLAPVQCVGGLALQTPLVPADGSLEPLILMQASLL